MPLHKVPDSRTGKGVFIQYVPHSGPPIRGRPGPESDREAGQNLVSEPAHEDEENEQRKGRQQRTITWTASRKQTAFTTRHMDSTDVPEHAAKPPLLPFIFITLLDFCIHPILERDCSVMSVIFQCTTVSTALKLMGTMTFCFHLEITSFVLYET